MKAIDEAVNKLPIEKLKKFAGYYLIRRINDLLTDFSEINEMRGKGAEDFPVNEPCQSIKKEFQEINLWAPEYDKLYEQSLKGKLNRKRVLEIYSEIIK